MVKIYTNLVQREKYNIKCPFLMKPTRIVIHNTASDACAAAEIIYMRRNNKETSFHYAVDDKEIVQGIPLDRNSWNAGDGNNGKGNREGISIEICYSKSGGDKFIKAVENSADLVVSLLKEYGWDISKVTKHQDYSGKHCPHRILDEYGWENYINLIKSKLNPATTTSQVKKTVSEIAKEVLNGKWGNGEERKKKLTNAGYDYSAVQNEVNKLLGKTIKKSNEEIAKEVLAGKWGNGALRKKKLTEAGYNYNVIQALVNKLSKRGKMI